jgi:hypothetical protein
MTNARIDLDETWQIQALLTNPPLQLSTRDALRGMEVGSGQTMCSVAAYKDSEAKKKNYNVDNL